MALATKPGLRAIEHLATTGSQAVELTGRLHPHVVVIDDSLGEPLQTTQMIRRRRPHAHVLILSALLSSEFVEAALDAGAAVVPKTVGLVDLAGTIQQIELGTPPVLAERRLASGPTSDTPEGRADQQSAVLANLSNRELEVVRLLSSGRSVKELAQELFVSDGTIRNHLHRILKKAGVGSQDELLRVLREVKFGTETDMDVWQPPVPPRAGVTVVVASEHRLLAESVGQALLSFPAIDVLGAYSGVGIGAMHTAIRRAPCVLLYDSALRAPTWWAAARYLDRWAPEVGVLMLSPTSDLGDAAIEIAGSGGTIDTTLSLAQVVETISEVAAQRSPTGLAAHTAVADEDWDRVEVLTPRELEVLQWLGRDCSTPKIARQLGIAPGTVRNHLTAILRKTETRSRREVAALVRKVGLA